MTHQTMEPTSRRLRRTLVSAFGGLLLYASLQSGYATQPAIPDPVPPPGVLLDPTQTPEQLDQLVAPIALYPDELVAQVLAAATYPTQVVEEQRWLQSRSDLKGSSLANAVNSQPWDDSVKALAQFPDVLAMMDENLSWTSSLGEAYMSNSQGVMDAVQQMRVRAQQAGNLQSTSQQNVTSVGQTVEIEPTDPDVVYVPEYDPWLVYGDPVAFYPDWVAVPGLFFWGPGIDFGFGIGIGVFGGFGWGWHHWGADWHGRGVFHNHAPYVSHSPAFGGHHGPGGFAHPGSFAHDAGLGGLHSGGLARPGDFHPGAISGGVDGAHPSAFSGFSHGGAADDFAARGRASVGGTHGGGFNGGGSHGGGFGGGHGGGR